MNPSWVFFRFHRLLPAIVVAGVLAASSADWPAAPAGANVPRGWRWSRTPRGAASRPC